MEMSPEARERQRIGQQRGGQRVIEAMALKRSLETPTGILAYIKAKAIAAMPRIVDRWVLGATGQLKGWTAPSQIRAGELVAGVAGVELEARAAGRPGGPLAELPLGELEGTLSGLLTQVHALQATDSKGNAEYQQGSNTQDGANSEPLAPIEGELGETAASGAGASSSAAPGGPPPAGEGD